MNVNAANYNPYAPTDYGQQDSPSYNTSGAQHGGLSGNDYGMYGASSNHMDPNEGYVTSGGGYYQQESFQQPYVENYAPDYLNGTVDYQSWNQQNPDQAEEAKPGSFYPIEDLIPQLYGAPVTAVAYDNSYSAVYAASATQSMSPGRGGHRASMWATHSTLDGMLYSAVGGHPEAPPKVLAAVYESLFGASPSASAVTAGRRTIPGHAYRPPFGATDPALADISGKGNYQMGITALLPMSGHVASTSPSGVRVHTHGGLQIADCHIEGIVCGTAHPNSLQNDVLTHVTAGGLALGDQSSHGSKSSIFCMDVWQGLRVVASSSISRHGDPPIAVTALAANHSKGSVVAGCSDGHVRVMDGRLREMAKIKSHVGGVVNVSVSGDGCLLATTGYGSRAPHTSVSPYSYPDPTVFIYDIRYLGRGGFAHPFAGMLGGPRHIAFLADVDDLPSNRLMVASGQAGGGIQIIEPFQETGGVDSFLAPQLERGESVSSMHSDETSFALGTSQGRILQYKRVKSRTKSIIGSTSFKSGLYAPKSPRSGDRFTPVSKKTKEKQPLEAPDFQPPVPPISLEPSLLLTDNSNARIGMNDKMKSIFGAYVLGRDPVVSRTKGNNGEVSMTSFGPLELDPLLAQSRMEISPNLISNTSRAVEFLQTVPTSELAIDLFGDQQAVTKSDGKATSNAPRVENPNRLIYSNKLFAVVYGENLNRQKRSGRRGRRGDKVVETSDDGDNVTIPQRYRLTLRPAHWSAATFDHSSYNKTGLFPGWDYPPTMPNAFVPPVLMLLYFLPEVRSVALKSQLGEKTPSSKDKNLLAPELGLLFHRLESIAQLALVFPSDTGQYSQSRLDAWAPSNFISCLSMMPEAEQLQILDGSPEAVPTPRRPEAFYRFLLYQLDKEISKTSSTRVIDSASGLSFTSINEFISGSSPPTTSTTRVLTVGLSYEPFLSGSEVSKEFGDVLQYSLCREARLRAWSQHSKSYETIVQRKIATSLPDILSLSGECAGRKEDEGLALWRGCGDGASDHWLPDLIEIELEESGRVVVRQLVNNAEDGSSSWKECRGSGSIPASISKIVAESTADSTIRKRRYRLDAVISIVRDDLDKACPEEARVLGENGPFGHHVLHVRAPKAYKKLVFKLQRDEVERQLESEVCDGSELTLMSGVETRDALKKRLVLANERLDAVDQTDDSSGSDWVLFNGYVVANTFVEDARAFHVPFKEPSVVVFRAVDTEVDEEVVTSIQCQVPSDAMKPQSLTSGSRAAPVQRSVLPGKGDLIAFDAEFVSVQEEESALAEQGTKLTICETRYAVARISVIDCRTKAVIIDDHVLPREPVVDYLTRFSGIVPSDLNPKQSRHNLISTRAAYLELRYLIERGCVFVGHGLKQDFWTANLAVPASQIIDTVEIYHKPAQRYISLRFLTNFVLKRDMQQDVHDSVEDAVAAFELYEKAIELKESGDFDTILNEIYEYGKKTDWKLGVDDEDINM